jgi:hypothetical protein
MKTLANKWLNEKRKIAENQEKASEVAVNLNKNQQIGIETLIFTYLFQFSFTLIKLIDPIDQKINKNNV